MNREDIKKIRHHLMLSQQGFSELLGVCFTTVCGWENGHHIPQKSFLAKMKKIKETIDEGEKVESSKL